MKGPRLLDRFLRGVGDVRAWAKKHKLDESTLSRLRRGERNPSFPMASRIAKATRGKVYVGAWAES